MKKLFFAVLVMAASVVYAAETVTVLEAELPMLRYQSFADSRFYIDTETREGFVKVSVTEERMTYNGGWGPYDHCFPGDFGRCYPGRYPTPVQVTVFQDTVKVEGLVLVDNKVIFHGAEGDVNCGTMGVSRVFKVPTLYLSGNCELSEKIVRTREGSKVVVTLTTK